MESDGLLGENNEGHHESVGFFQRHRLLLMSFALLILVACLVAAIAVPLVVISLDSDDEDDTLIQFPSSITAANIMGHLQNLQNIAIQNGDTRSAGTPGYAASAQYIQDSLASFGETYRITTQDLVAPVYTENAQPMLSLAAPYTVEFRYGTDFQGMRYGGNGTYTLSDWPVAQQSLVANDGCSEDDWKEFPSNTVALVANRNTQCNAYEKALQAEAAGAAGLLLYSSSLSNSRVRATEWTSQSAMISLPVLSVTNTVAQVVQQSGSEAKVSLFTNTSTKVVSSQNVFATTLQGHSDSVVMFGSHLDSVPAGPGLNDNGSGSCTNLEMAISYAQEKLTPHNRIVFAWWAAEEEGLIGSRHFVRDLQQNNASALASIAAYINMDMLASPNYILYVYDGNTAPPDVSEASSKLDAILTGRYNASGLPWKYSAMTGGSDFYPFIHAGVPATGLLTGAGGLKSAAEREKYGGLANTPFDPCYHQECDSILNINQEALGYTSDAAAYALEILSSKPKLREWLSEPAVNKTRSLNPPEQNMRWFSMQK